MSTPNPLGSESQPHYIKRAIERFMEQGDSQQDAMRKARAIWKASRPKKKKK